MLMSLWIIILFSSFKIFLNLPSPIQITSFKPFYLNEKEVLFELDYKSDEKVDIICIFEPYLNNIIFGKMSLFSNITTFENNKINNEIYEKTFIFKTKTSIIINSSDIWNKG